MERMCSNCKHYTDGIPDSLRKKWNDHWSTGVCNLYFPRGYIGRKPPHPASCVGRCFQWEERDQTEQLALEI